jgi:hypothetical protein
MLTFLQDNKTLLHQKDLKEPPADGKKANAAHGRTFFRVHQDGKEDCALSGYWLVKYGCAQLVKQALVGMPNLSAALDMVLLQIHTELHKKRKRAEESEDSEPSRPTSCASSPVKDQEPGRADRRALRKERRLQEIKVLNDAIEDLNKRKENLLTILAELQVTADTALKAATMLKEAATGIKP